MLYDWLVADVSQCSVIIVCIYDVGELMPHAAVTSPLRHSTNFVVWQQLGQYACYCMIEKHAHRDKRKNGTNNVWHRVPHIVALYLTVGHSLQFEPPSMACLGLKQRCWGWIIRLFLRTSHHIYDANLTTSGMLLIGKSKIKMVIKLNVHQKLNFFNFYVGIPEIITLVRKYWKLMKKN